MSAATRMAAQTPPPPALPRPASCALPALPCALAPRVPCWGWQTQFQQSPPPSSEPPPQNHETDVF